MFTAVILCGGSGTRLWPASRRALPKQFIPLTDNYSSFQQTILRTTALPGFGAPLVVTGDIHSDIVQQQLEDIGQSAQLLVEPEGRDSAPAIAAAATYLARQDKNAGLLVLAADHHVADVASFRQSILVAVEAAEAGHIATFGVKPSYPSIGYGYIAPGEKVVGLTDTFRVKSFVEKPDFATALRYIADGYVWNSGNFAFRADVFLRELHTFEPSMAEAVSEAVLGAAIVGNRSLLDPEPFRRAPKKPVDYAVMERTERGVVIPVDIGWSDLGTWHAIWEILAHDASNNAVVGDGIAIGCQGTLVYSKDRLTAVIGVEDLVVVTTRDAVLVCPRGQSQLVKEVVDRLAAAGRPEVTALSLSAADAAKAN
jgi:mannose-1-phosphate guanylyltransferase